MLLFAALRYRECSQNDEDFLPGEYFDKLPSPNSNLQHPSTAAAIITEVVAVVFLHVGCRSYLCRMLTSGGF
jgi:hypothetical protein